jgi:hypothetical protein
MAAIIPKRHTHVMPNCNTSLNQTWDVYNSSTIKSLEQIHIQKNKFI